MTWLTDPAHRRWLEGETDRLLEFSRAARHPAGGFAWLDERGRPLLDQPVELWVTCRMTHVFALGQLWAGRAAGRWSTTACRRCRGDCGTSPTAAGSPPWARTG